MPNDNYSRYRQYFSESAFKDKLSEIGGAVKENAMILYWVFKEPFTPLWVKLLIISALGYLIWVVDVIPDIVPVFGYADDLAVMAGLLVTIETYITPEIRRKARQ
ncbi:YkvA family protein [Geobacter anodireducens]|uniref:DUF1232 domain-containing protein n=1 Tax=Geobacter anodireducens TaxID=1340425 RepID=A0ABR9NXZ8_9BACT|nr:DUF1232 domain-containing protein [Geobacter anodireducens]MBE2889131.1 DUF1232 domain-containing protein [Geobacter anodireducens]